MQLELAHGHLQLKLSPFEPRKELWAGSIFLGFCLPVNENTGVSTPFLYEKKTFNIGTDPSCFFYHRPMRQQFYPHRLNGCQSRTLRFSRTFLPRTTKLWPKLSSAILQDQYELQINKRAFSFLSFKKCATSLWRLWYCACKSVCPFSPFSYKKRYMDVGKVVVVRIIIRMLPV